MEQYQPPVLISADLCCLFWAIMLEFVNQINVDHSQASILVVTVDNVVLNCGCFWEVLREKVEC